MYFYSILYYYNIGNLIDFVIILLLFVTTTKYP